MSGQIKIQNKHEITWDDKYWFSSSMSWNIIDFLENELPSYAYTFDRESDTYRIDSDFLKELLDNIKSGESKVNIKPLGNYTIEEVTEELIKFIEELIEQSKSTGGFAYFDIF